MPFRPPCSVFRRDGVRLEEEAPDPVAHHDHREHRTELKKHHLSLWGIARLPSFTGNSLYLGGSFVLIATSTESAGRGERIH